MTPSEGERADLTGFTQRGKAATWRVTTFMQRMRLLNRALGIELTYELDC